MIAERKGHAEVARLLKSVGVRGTLRAYAATRAPVKNVADDLAESRDHVED